MFQPQRRLAIAAAIALACSASTVFAQTAWPSQPLKIVVGFPAGSSPDLMARLLAEPLQQALGQPDYIATVHRLDKVVGGVMLSQIKRKTVVND